MNLVEGTGEMLVVEAEVHGIYPKNPIGIQFREVLGLVFFQNVRIMPQVRALRPDFPETPHRNHVEQGKPKSLCLYFEPWPEVRRTWTPEKHLSRILWWLEQTSLGTLHRKSQPVERVYFESPWELVLPFQFNEMLVDQNIRLILERRPERKRNEFTLVGSFVKPDAGYDATRAVNFIPITLQPVVHGAVEMLPPTLGDLEDTLASRNASFIEKLFEHVREQFKNGRHHVNPADAKTILILSIPISREAGVAPESHSVKAYFIGSSLIQIGEAAGIVSLHNNKPGINITRVDCADWKQIRLLPMDVLETFTPDLARKYSGIESVGPKASLVGVGSLGSALFNLWSRMGWGNWTLVDPDHIKPHNLSRHTAVDSFVGIPKVDAAISVEHAVFGIGAKTSGIFDDAARMVADGNLDPFLDSSLVVDASTTFEFPHEYASNAKLPRGCSVFLTPSGNGSVLIAEDKSRSFRLDALEAQYYRQILEQDWGGSHLDGNLGEFWSGAGCRDVSTVMPIDTVTVHAGILAKQIRRLAQLESGSIKVWHYNSDAGSIQVYDTVPQNPIIIKSGDLEVIWDEGLQKKIRGIRESRLPNETGGVLLGYHDLPRKKVYIVDVLPQPSDSEADVSGFARGTNGLADDVKRVEERTANMVSYIGEWHSHPKGYPSTASGADIFLLAHLATALSEDGHPALMLIVGEKEESILYAKMGDGVNG